MPDKNLGCAYDYLSAVLSWTAEHSDVWRLVSQLEHNKADLENFELGAGIFFDFYNLKTNLSSEDDVMEEMVSSS